jgi:hypothetical protein
MTLVLTIIVLAGGEALNWLGPDASPGTTLLGLLVVLWMPAVSAWAARRVMSRPLSIQPESKLWPLPTVPALAAAILVPLVFALVYLVLSLLGFAAPNWSVSELMAIMPGAGTPGASDVSPALLLVLAFVVTLLAGPTLYAAAVVGNEYGWRGFLLPRLLPMGRLKAYGLAGLAWAVWLTLVYARLGMLGTAADAAIRFLVVIFAFSFVLNEIWRRFRNHGLSAVALGAFAINLEGVWAYLFPNDFTPWGGTTGVVAIVIWGVCAFMIVSKGNRAATASE